MSGTTSIRAGNALRRFESLAPKIGGRDIPEKALPYLQEVVTAYLFGFDTATIALCRATLEQVVKDIVVRLGLYTEPGLKRDKVKLRTMLLKLKQADALERSFEAAKRVRENGDTSLPRHPFDAKIRKTVALDSIASLSEVLTELLP